MSVGVIVKANASGSAFAAYEGNRPLLPDEPVRVCDGDIARVMRCCEFVDGIYKTGHKHHNWIINNVIPAMRAEGRILVR